MSICLQLWIDADCWYDAASERAGIYIGSASDDFVRDI